MTAYYNENDAEKAAVIRELIRANVVAPGEVDERSITDVSADDVRGYTQCHWFAGFGVWSYALRLAGWADDRAVWTGSCPCPSFSSAGKGQGFDDARHLWPDWVRLIRECKPAVVFGEQADDAIGYGWLDLVQTDLEAQAYAVGKIVLGACSVGAPHIRQRLYFCADTASSGRQSGAEITGLNGAGMEPPESITKPGIDGGLSGGCADTEHAGHNRPHGAEAVTDCDQPEVRIPDGDSAAVERCESTGRGCTPGRPSQEVSGEEPCSEIERPGDAGQLSDTESERLREAGSSSGRSTERAGDHGEPIERTNTLHSERRPLMQHGSDGRDGADAGRSEAHGESGTCGEVRHGGDSAQRGLAMHGSASGNAGHAALTDEAGSGDHAERDGRRTRRDNDTADERIIVDATGQSLSGDHAIGPRLEGQFRDERIWRGPGWLDPDAARSATAAGATRGFWADCDWWYGRDGKYRPIGPGIFPLAHGVANRVLKLRGYGDAINAEVAKAFIEAYCEARWALPFA